jgi:hypothetical protein
VVFFFFFFPQAAYERWPTVLFLTSTQLADASWEVTFGGGHCAMCVIMYRPSDQLRKQLEIFPKNFLGHLSQIQFLPEH